MKIRSLLLAGLLAGQVMPVVGMHHNFFMLIKNQINAARGATQHLAYALKSNRSLVAKAVAKLVVGELAFLGVVFGLAHLYGKYEIGYKIDCAFGNYSLESQLLRATWKSDLVTMEKLLNKGADPNVNAYSHDGLLLTAINKNNEKMLDLAIKAGADVNAKDFLFFVLMARAPFNKNMAKKLIEAGANPDMGGVRQFAQAEAARTGNQDYINIFKPETKLL